VYATPLTPNSWNTYNHYNCYPDEEIFRSNAKALVDFGLADLGYRYATIDCGWTLTERLANGSLTWNATRFPSGFPAIADYLHDLGLLFGVYGDAGIKLCGPSDEVGNLGERRLRIDSTGLMKTSKATKSRMHRPLLRGELTR
jgi:alpha-galactosidase